MIISNSSPLIYLAKIKKLELLKILFKEIIVPREVYEEITGKKEKYLDALKIEKAIEEGWIKIRDAKIEKDVERFSSEIDLGEIALINLATKSKKPESLLLLIDDASARTIAESFGFNVKGTLYVLLKAYKNNLIKKEETKDLINRLIFSGFRISQEVYIELMRELE